MKIALHQQNFIVGDLEGNTKKILMGYREALKQNVDLVVSSELGILGYPPRDLLEYPHIIEKQMTVLYRIAKQISHPGLIVGFAEPNISGKGKPLFNSAALLWKGRIAAIRRKCLLPTYDVFDEQRYFEPYIKEQKPIVYKGKKIGLLICEDIWNEDITGIQQKPYAYDPVTRLFSYHPDFLVVINGSPYWWGKGDVRFNLVRSIARKYKKPAIYLNQVGGNDELIFDGRSFAVNSRGECSAMGETFKEDMIVVDLDSTRTCAYVHDSDNLAQLEEALVCGVRDYFTKTGFQGGVVIGLSGGIDSALTAYIAVRALGRERVLAVSMPSPYSSRGSIEDARTLAKNLGIEFQIVPIGNVFQVFAKTLKPVIGWFDPPRVPEENIQARIRGMILMAIANREHRLVLGTGNKSELAVGYATLYGDMACGLGVISDLPKTLVYKLAKFINRDHEVIPRKIITKAPSAELRPNQKDTDSLPPYDVLDTILGLYVEEKIGLAGMVKKRLRKNVVKEIIVKVNKNEFKRRQMAPGLKVTGKAFGSGRRMPIAARIPL